MKKMLKRADGSTSQRGLWDNIREKAAANKKAGKKGKAPSKDILRAEASIEKKGMGGNWLKESQELMFGGPTNKKNKYLDGGPSMDTKTAVGQVFQGKMTAEQGQAAIGKTAKPAMTPEQKTEFMSKLKTYGKKTGGKKRMGGKNC